MSLAVFDVTKNHAKIGALFDSSKKYVYKNPYGSAGAVIRMPHLWTLYNTANSLTYAFDGETFTVGPAPPVLPSTSPSPSIFYLGVI